jgi:hypothetical protein
MDMIGRSNPAFLTQRIIALVLFLICAAYLYAATGFTFGGWSNPKAGFMPTIVGVLGVLLSAGNLARVVQARLLGPADFGASPARALAFLVVLLLYAGVLGTLGFLPATFLASLSLLKVGQVRGFVFPIIIAACFAGGIWMLFGRLLQLPLP